MAKSKTLKKKIKYTIYIIILLILLPCAIIYSPLLNIGYVEINGNKTISREEILKISNLGEPLNVFYVDKDEVKNALEKDLRVDYATVTRDGFNKIIINVKEREKIAIVQTNYGYAEINYEGLVLQVDKNLPKAHLPLIKGIVVNDVYINDNIDIPSIKNVLTYLQWLSPAYRDMIMEVDFTGDGNVEMITYQGARIILGKVEDPTNLAAESNSFFHEIVKSEIPLDYVNFSYARPVLKFKQ